MDKRFQVFVSSTYRDLIEERNEVVKALLELDCIPCGMEYFPAASEDQWTYIKSLIDYCDYYIVVIGGRYGSLAVDGISYTQKEYEYATEKGIPAIAFVHVDPGSIASDKSEQSAEGRAKLEAFTAMVRRRLCKQWGNSHELGAVVSRSITQLIKRHPRTGWIRADQAVSAEGAQEIVRLSKKVHELEEALALEAASRSTVDRATLAKGDESLQLSFKAYYVNNRLEYWDPNRKVKMMTSISSTWSLVFRHLAPHLLNGLPESSIKRILALWAEDQFSENIMTRNDGYKFSSSQITNESMTLLKIQFTALNYIESYQHETKHKQQTGWRLTRDGESEMYSAIAIKTR